MNGKPISVTSSLISKIRSLRAYGLTWRAIGKRLDLAESSVHKIALSTAYSKFSCGNPLDKR